jgi:hypothetical protein
MLYTSVDSTTVQNHKTECHVPEDCNNDMMRAVCILLEADASKVTCIHFFYFSSHRSSTICYSVSYVIKSLISWLREYVLMHGDATSALRAMWE